MSQLAHDRFGDLSPGCAARVAELSELQAGWLEFATPGPSAEVIDTVELVLTRSVDQKLPRPLIFPSSEGGVQLEWHGATANLEVQILNNRVIDVAWFETESDACEERRFMIDEVEAVMQFVMTHLRPSTWTDGSSTTS